MSPQIPTDMPEVYRVQASETRINLLVYAEPGVGKTTLAAQAQDHEAMQDVLLLNIEGGTLSIAGRGDIHAMDIQSVEHLEAVYWALKRREEGLGTIKTVIIDSGSELQQLDLEEIVASSIDKLERQADAGDRKAKEKLENRSRDDIWLEDYGESSARLKRLFRWFRDLNVNVITTALVKKEYPTDRSEDPNVIRPQFTQSLCESVEGYHDFVWHMYTEGEWPETGNKKRKLLTQAAGAWHAKTRGPNFRRAIGRVVTLADVDDENDTDGLTLPDIYDLLIESEGA